MKLSNLRVFILIFLSACAPLAQQTPHARVLKHQGRQSVAETSEQYQLSCEQALQTATQQFQTLETYQGRVTEQTVLEPLNAMWMTIDRTLNRAGLYRNVHPDAAMRTAADRCEQSFSALVTEIGLSQKLYRLIQQLDIASADAATQHYVQNMIRDFRRSGVDRSDSERAQIKTLREELVKIGQLFNKNIREDVRYITLSSVDELKGLPEDYIAQHKPGTDGTIRLSTDYPDYLPYMTYALSDTKRKEFYTVFRQRGYPHNEAVLKDLITKRHELATLLGYKTWASYVTEDKMIGSAEAAQSFIDKISAAAAPRAKRDYAELLKQWQTIDPKATHVQDWQKAFIEEQVKKESYRFDSQAARSYFRYGAVQQGIFDLVSKMFGVRFQKIDVPVWHSSVQAFEMLDQHHVIGRFYLDMHPRADKYNHAAAFPIQSGVGGVQIPEAALVCNFPGENDANALMEHDQVETFLHEFGHLLHHLFAGKPRWVGLSGIATEWDFVEAPSQMLEEWAFDAETLKTFARNAQGDVIPDTMIESMRKARDFGKGLWVRHQMFYAALSLAYYNTDPSKLNILKTMTDLQHRYSAFEYVPNTYFHLSFGHLEGYSAIYYTYMWSLVIAKDLFSRFEHEGMLNSKVASDYRRYVLEPGGSAKAAELVQHFLGRPYGYDSFSAWLNEKQ